MPLAESDSSIIERWRAHLGPDVFGQPILLVPYRHSDRGWFDWNPVQASVPWYAYLRGDNPGYPGLALAAAPGPGPAAAGADGDAC